MRYIKNFIFSILVVAFFSVFLFVFSSLVAKLTYSKELVNLNRVGLQYHNFLNPSRDALIVPSIPNTSLNSQIRLSVDLDLLKYFYWQNNIYTITDRMDNNYAQFRYVAWQYQFGLRLFKNFSLEFYHKSEHLLDSIPKISYPMVNSIGFNYTIYTNPKKPDNLF